MAKEWSNYLTVLEKSRAITKNNMIIDGFNGTPSDLITIVKMRKEIPIGMFHTRRNAILKVAKSTNSCNGRLFI